MWFSVLWGAVIGVALTKDDHEMAVFGVFGMLLTLVLTILLYRQQSALRSLAETDSLTDLTNHRGFQEVLRSDLRAAAAKRSTVALVVLDLDDFKAINERHGHPFGDGVLRGIGAQLRKLVRVGDTAARTGG
jgi:PleD family two-component response regulator